MKITGTLSEISRHASSDQRTINSMSLSVDIKHSPDTSCYSQFLTYRWRDDYRTQLFIFISDSVFFIFLKYTIKPEGTDYLLTFETDDQSTFSSFLYMSDLQEMLKAKIGKLKNGQTRSQIAIASCCRIF